MVLGRVILVDTLHSLFSCSTYESTYVAQMLNILTSFSFTQINAIYRSVLELSNAHYHLGAFNSNPVKYKISSLFTCELYAFKMYMFLGHCT
jgi:hypothetical protein